MKTKTLLDDLIDKIEWQIPQELRHENEDARLFFANLPALKAMVNNRFDEYQNGWLIQFHQWLLNLQPVIDCDEVIAAFNKFAEHYRTT